MTPDEAEALRKPFPASAIGKLPRGGVDLDYVGHAATTDRLLAVDPEWTWEPVAFDQLGLPAFTQNGCLWIRLTVCGVTRYGVGDGKSIKECIGDAIRNAAMRFGVALDLWSKEELEQHRAPATRPPQPAAPPLDRGGDPEPKSPGAQGSPLLNTSGRLARAMYAAIREAGIPKENVHDLLSDVTGRTIGSSKELTDAEARLVLDHLPTQPTQSAGEGAPMVSATPSPAPEEEP